MEYILTNGAWEVLAAILTYTAAVPQGFLLVLVVASVIALGCFAVLLIPRWGAIKEALKFKGKK